MLVLFWQVLIFAEKKADVDAIHEYLLLKGVEAVAIHGGKGEQNNKKKQSQRQYIKNKMIFIYLFIYLFMY